MERVVVRLAAGGPDAALTPSVGNASFGADVAVVDLGGVSAIAAVSAPAAGRVYLFDLSVNELSSTVSVTPQGFVSGGTDFGRSIALSSGNLVVGDPFDGVPTPGAGAAWVYERTGPGATFTGDPVKLQASDAEVSDTLGDDVAIDGNVIVVGAPIAQKSGFPLRDGAAYVYPVQRHRLGRDRHPPRRRRLQRGTVRRCRRRLGQSGPCRCSQ